MNESGFDGTEDLTVVGRLGKDCPENPLNNEIANENQPSDNLNQSPTETDSSHQINFTMHLFLLLCSIVLFAASAALQVHIKSRNQSEPYLQSQVPSDGPQTVYQNGVPPAPFFPDDNHVIDSYDGSLGAAFNKMNECGIVFVMYYSHWSRGSRLAREEFSVAASLMRQVPFVAINCWYSSGECVTQYKFHQYPVFYIYMAGIEKGFYYNGAHNHRYMMRFVSSLMNPLTYIHNASHFLTFISHFDSSMLGYFQLGYNESQPVQPNYQQFYFASLRSIEADFLQPVRFGVISDHEVARHLSLLEHNDMVLVQTTQANLEYPEANNYTSSAITQWVNENKQRPLVPWLQFDELKSENLHSYLSEQPTLLLFTPLDACSSTNADVDLLREVALEHHSCSIRSTNNSYLSTKLKTHLGVLFEKRLRSPSSSACLTCPGETLRNNLPHCQANDNIHVCQVDCPKIRLEPCNTSIIMKNTQSIIHLQCSCLVPPFLYPSLNQICCLTIGCERKFTDPYIYNRRNCSYVPPLEPEIINHSSTCLSHSRPVSSQTPVDICHRLIDNQTIVFLAIDSLTYPHMMLNLGLERCASAPSVAMIDLQGESHYVMAQPYSKLNLLRFIDKYSAREIERSFVSHSKHTTGRPRELVKDIDNQYLHSLHNKNKESLIYFYTHWCLACRTTRHVITTVAVLLQKKIGIEINFYKLDVSQETLDWKYHPGEIPSVILFSGCESYYMKEKITVETLLRFILRYSQRPTLINALAQYSSAIPSYKKYKLELTLKNNVIKLCYQISDLKRARNDVSTSRELESILNMSINRKRLKLKYLYKVLRIIRMRASFRQTHIKQNLESLFKCKLYIEPPVR